MTHNKRHRWLAIALCSTPLLIATPAQAENPDHVLQLLPTGACAHYDIQGVSVTHQSAGGTLRLRLISILDFGFAILDCQSNVFEAPSSSIRSAT